MSTIAQKGDEQYAFRPREEVKRIDDIIPRAAANGLCARSPRHPPITIPSDPNKV